MSIKEIGLKLHSMSKQLESVLPKQLPADRFKRTVLMALERNPYLLKLDQESLFKSCQLAAADGLLLDGREAALVPFKGQIQYIPMYQGLLKKIRQSGELKSITTQLVYDNDDFDYWVDENGQHLKHRPDFKDRGEIIFAYAVAVLKDGGTQIDVMTIDEINKVRDSSSAAGSKHSPWNTWFEEMAKKTVFRRISKYLPSSSELENVYANEEIQITEIRKEKDITPKSKEKPSSIEALIDDFTDKETGEIVIEENDFPEELF